MQSPAELELIRRSKEGDQQAFGKLVKAHQSFAYAVAYKFTGVVNEAEDITQEAFVKLWQNLDKFREGTKLSTWLYKIIMNRCLDLLKSSRRRHDRQSLDVDSGHLVADENSLEKRQDDLEALNVIIGLAKELTPMQQSVFVLRDLESLPVEEVVTLTGMDPVKVKSNLYYARLKIREGLIQHYQSAKKIQ